jgi:hypothetical protein
MYYEKDTYHKTKDCSIYLESKRKMNQKSNELPPTPSLKEVNHRTHWPQPLPQTYFPSYPPPHSRQVYPSTHQGQPPSYYQSYHYATNTNQSKPAPLPITYLLPLPQITYPIQTTKPIKTKLIQIHCHLRLCSHKNLCNTATISQSMAQFI